MDILHGTVRIRSSLSLEEIGGIVSQRVLGGVRLEGRENNIRDEVPAIYSQTPVLGLRFILQGEPDEEGYYLSANSWKLGLELSPAEIKSRLRDISDLLASLLQGAEGIEIPTRSGAL